MKNLIALFIISNSVCAQTVTRGPYLQQATPNSIIIKWQTNVATITKVNYGVLLPSLLSTAVSTITSTNHEIKITGLLPYTKYFYSLSTATST